MQLFQNIHIEETYLRDTQSDVTVASTAAMELTLQTISKRLTLDVIDKSFKERTNTKDAVKSVAVSRAAPPGEGLISAVYRIQVTGSVQKASFIAKGLVNDLLLRQTLHCNELFGREILFFSEILPWFKELQKSLGATEDIQRHIPICYSYHIGNDEHYLLLEDLSESSCKSVAKPTKQDRDSILKVLAHLHAVSMALRIHKPNVFSKLANKLTEVYYTDDNHKWYSKYLQNAIEIDKQVLSECVNESSVYYRKFLETVNCDVYKQLKDLVSYSGEHPTMNHGDAWLPNFMYSEGRAVIIDFQLFRCTSPVIDLTYYLALCSRLCPTKEDFQDALNLYYSFLKYYLEDMKLNAEKVFSQQDLDDELKKYGRFGLLAALTSIPLLGSSIKCDVGLSYQDKFDGVERIPLEDLWKLSPMTDPELKNDLLSAVRVAVDMELI